MPEEEQSAVAKAGFSSRQYSLLERGYMGTVDGLLFVIGCILRVGGLPLKRGLSTVLGTAVYWALPDKRRIAHINLDLAYGSELSDREKRRIARRMFVHFIRLGLEFIFDTVYWPPDQLDRRVRVEGLDKLEEAFSRGRGVLCVSGHLGNWELMCASAAAHGYDFFGVFKRPKSPWGDRFIGRKRLRYGMSLLEIPDSSEEIVDGVKTVTAVFSLRDEIEKLWDSGRAVAYLCDQHPRRGKVPVPFLGVPDTPTSGGLIRYAVAKHVPLTLHHCVYGDDGNLVWTIEGPIDIVDQPGGEEATTLHYLGIVNDWLSDRIREYPEQWTWGHRRFERSLYPRRKGAKSRGVEAPATP